MSGLTLKEFVENFDNLSVVTVKKKYFEGTNNISCMSFHNEKGQLHRDPEILSDGTKVSRPASIAYYENGSEQYLRYIINGSLHRDDGPAYIDKSKEGNVTYMAWYMNGNPHRTDGPSSIDYYSDMVDVICFVHYKQNGVLHRVDGPALIVYERDGITKKEEKWYFEGKLHRVDGPAHTKWSNFGKFTRKIEWYVHGVLHRDDGPALIKIHKNTDMVKSERWYKYNKLHRDDDLPAVILHRDQIWSDPTTELYYKENYLHRDDDKPAKIVYTRTYDNDDPVIAEYWYVESKLHRIGKPAVVIKRKNLDDYTENYINGKLVPL
jgi:hypothetical protein